MKKHSISTPLLLTLLLILLLFPLQTTYAGGFSTPLSEDSEPVYYPADIAIINNIIDNNGLNWTKALEDGSEVPGDWTGVTWSDYTTNKRVIRLDISNQNLSGELLIAGLSQLVFKIININNYRQ